MATNTPEVYRRVTDDFDRIVHAVPKQGWESQSPCEEWKAIDVVGHVAGIYQMMRGMATGEETNLDWTENRERAGADPVASWTLARDAMNAAVAGDAWQRLVPNPSGGPDVPLSERLPALLADVAIHAWDLATAAGQPFQIDADLIADGVERFKAYGEESLRQPGLLAPAVPVPDDASAEAQLLAWSGRKPR